MLLILILCLCRVAGVSAQSSAPGSSRDWERQAQQAAARHDWVEAAADYRDAIELAPKAARLRTELGTALRESKDYPGAIAAFKDALRLEPHGEASELGLAEVYRLVFNYGEARRTLERAMREHPASAAPPASLGRLEIELQRFDPAIVQLTHALELAPHDIAARTDLAAAYQARGELAKALAELDIVLTHDPANALGRFLRAEIYADGTPPDNERALEDAEKVFAAEPDNPRGRMLLGKILLRIPKCDRAVEILQPLGATDPHDSEALFLLSRAYDCAGHAEEAEKARRQFEEVSKADRGSKENTTQAGHMVHDANALAMKNQFPEAMALLNQALEKDPQSSEAYAQLAKIYFSENEVEKADEAVRRALAIRPFNPDYLYVLGKIFERHRKLDDALHACEQVTLVNPRESDAYFEMGAIHRERGERAAAIAAFKKAVALSPDDGDYRKALEGILASAPTANP